MMDTEKKTEGLGGFGPMTISDADFRRMVNFIQSSYGIDLSQKKQLITSRLSPALKKLGYKSFGEFVNHLLEKKENDEVTLVLNKLTTNYTFFMREKEHLDYFCNNIIPEIVRRHERDKTLAIWSAGCSSGEEPYNITMFLYDYLGPRGPSGALAVPAGRSPITSPCASTITWAPGPRSGTPASWPRTSPPRR